MFCLHSHHHSIHPSPTIHHHSIFHHYHSFHPSNYNTPTTLLPPFHTHHLTPSLSTSTTAFKPLLKAILYSLLSLPPCLLHHFALVRLTRILTTSNEGTSPATRPHHGAGTQPPRQSPPLDRPKITSLTKTLLTPSNASPASI